MELEHKRPKRLSSRSSRSTKLLAPGIAKQQQRERTIHQIKQARRLYQHRNKVGKYKGLKDARVSFNLSERLPLTPPNIHHHMSNEVKPQNRIDILEWCDQGHEDPALMVC